MNKGRNYDNKYDLNSIKEENYSSSLNTQHNLYDSQNNYSNNILDLENNTGRYSYNYNYDWFKNINNNNENSNGIKDNINEINNLNNLLQKGNIILSQINLDFNNYKEFNYNEEEKIKNGYLMLEKNSTLERYTV